jgi:hypothetical protein
MDAASRAEEMLEQGATTEEIVRRLREEGFSIIVSMSALAKGVGMSRAEAREAVLESPIWADQRHLVSQRAWIYPPDPPDEATLERLRVACRDEPRIVEAWVTGSRMTRADGSSSESTDIVLILDDPPHDDTPHDETANVEQSLANFEVTRTLEAAAPSAAGQRSWLFMSKRQLEAHEPHCIEIYTRAPDAE